MLPEASGVDTKSILMGGAGGMQGPPPIKRVGPTLLMGGELACPLAPPTIKTVLVSMPGPAGTTRGQPFNGGDSGAAAPVPL